jgi:plastocyanin
MIRRALGLIAITLGVLASPMASAPGTTHKVLIQGFQFVPQHLEVAVGDTVIWENKDIVPHTATSKKVFDSKNLDAGQSWTYVAKRQGKYEYICTYHPTMKGELVVK